MTLDFARKEAQRRANVLQRDYVVAFSPNVIQPDAYLVLTVQQAQRYSPDKLQTIGGIITPAQTA